MPVPYIVALVIAAIVLIIIGFWLARTSSSTSGAASNEMCRAKLMAFCIGKSGDTLVNPSNYKECTGTQLGSSVNTCADL